MLQNPEGVDYDTMKQKGNVNHFKALKISSTGNYS
jgi:hypothetical protein